MTREPATTDQGLRAVTTNGAWLQVLIRTLDAQGYDGAEMAIRAGVAPRHVRTPTERIHQLAMTAFWKLAVDETNNPALGLDVARFVTQSTFGALTHVAFVSPTLEDAFRRVVHFQQLMTDSMTLELVRVKDRNRLTIHPVSTDHPPAEELDAFWATWVRVARSLASHEPYVEPIRMHRRRKKPADADVFQRVFRSPIRFRAEEDFVEYNWSECQKRLPDANLELAMEYDQILARQAAQLDNAGVTERVRALLFEILVDRPTEDDVARRLYMSRSSLKASLARESTTYRAILNDVRKNLAARYLTERSYTIKEVAFLLGYADASTFSRAFRGWTGQAPAAFAEHSRGRD